MPARHRQFSLKAIANGMSVVAMLLTAARLGLFAKLFPFVVLSVIFGPICAWTLAHGLRRMSSHVAPWIYGLTALLSLYIVATSFIANREVALAVTLLVWLPQVIFVSFFEWCEHEHRQMLKEEAARQVSDRE